jgi:hypothetical protein
VKKEREDEREQRRQQAQMLPNEILRKEEPGSNSPQSSLRETVNEVSIEPLNFRR